jgi:rRNA maturation protein Rpf1
LQVISEIIESCRAHDYTDVILVHEHRGVPDGLVICHLPFGPTAYFELLNVVSSWLFLHFLGVFIGLMFWGILYAD